MDSKFESGKNMDHEALPVLRSADDSLKSKLERGVRFITDMWGILDNQDNPNNRAVITVKRFNDALSTSALSGHLV